MSGGRWKPRLAVLLAAGLAIAGLISCRGRKAEIPNPQPRNASVLLITLDTTRADHLSCYGTGFAKTSNLDALAARGVRFEHAIAQVPLTLPSHACIMTGSYPEVNGVRGMAGFTLSDAHPTIASVSRAAGYATAAFVGSSVLGRRFGFSTGFEIYDDDMGRSIVESNQTGVHLERRASVVTDHAIDWLKSNGNKNFFLWCHFYDPHAPYEPPEPYKHLYSKDPYSGEIAYTDSQVGRLLDYLKAQGLLDRTLIVATADHGESLGEHGEETHGVFLYDATVHVPLIIAGPGIPAGKAIAQQVRSIDIMPTILAFLHLSPGKEAQGLDLLPLIQKGQPLATDTAYLETLYPRTYMGWSELRAVRTNQWKFILAPRSELYNLTDDPREATNVESREPVIASRLDAQIWSIIGQDKRNEKVVSSPMTEQTREDLASLGYVSGGTPRVIQLGSKAPDPKDETGVLKILGEVERLMERREFGGAARLMEKGLKQDPTNPLGITYLASSFENLGNFPRAIQVYEKAIGLHVETDQIYSRLGKDYLRTHQLEKAVQAMQRAAELNPTDLDNLSNLGAANLQLRRPQEARKAFEAITAQSDSYAPAFNGLGLLAISQGDSAAAMRNFMKAVNADPSEMEPLLNLGFLYQRSGQKQQALHCFQTFLRKAPRGRYGKLFPMVRETIRQLQSGA
ncbi:MAG TPA: sulfatase-like hydrolase/transferase [Terriglobia bacterium]|nr:sulfatase-like hydrolase/transferase [Terriglobia bacterium]